MRILKFLDIPNYLQFPVIFPTVNFIVSQVYKGRR